MYTDKDKEILLNILYQKDFDIKNSVIEFNKLTTHSLERGTVYDWLKKDPVFIQKYAYFKSDLIKEAEAAHRLLRKGIPVQDDEGNIIGWIEKPDRAAIEFFLKTIGSTEGYIDKTINENTNINHNIEVKPPKWDD